MQWSQERCLPAMVWSDAHLLCEKKNCLSCCTMFQFATQISCRNLVDDFSSLVSSVPCPRQGFETDSGYCAGDRAAVSRKPPYPVQCTSETPSSAATILTHLLKKGATICPIFASLHYRLGGKEPHLLTVTA